MLSKRLPVIFLLFFSSFVYSQTGWEGEWIDKCENEKCFGGNLTICATNGEIFGRYSNIGFLKGTILNENQVAGVWYEAGYTTENYGGFEFRFVSENEFTGSWWFGIDSCIRNPWSSMRLSSIKPDAQSCGILMPENKAGARIIEGEWINNDGSQKIWLCADDGVFFHGSGTSSLTGNNYYVAGKSFESSTVLTGSSWIGDLVEPQGIFIIVFLSADEFVLSFWFVPSNTIAKNNLFSVDTSGSVYFTKNRNFANSTLAAACNTYNSFPDTFYYLGWHGSFFDTRFGLGQMHICPTNDFNNTFHGVYSEIGWLEGFIDGNTIFGEYYNSGAHPNLDTGSFELKLVNNGHSFEGFYTIRDTPVVWRGDRSNSLILPAATCWAPVAFPDSATLKGQWYYGKRAGDSFDICINDDSTVEISYFYNGDTPGYAVGYISDSGPHSIRATWFEHEGVYGVSMYRWKDDFTMIESLWASVQSVYDITYAICKLDNLDAMNFYYWGRHSVHEITLFTASQNERRCSRNKDLYNPAVIFDPDYGSSTDNGAASSLKALSIFSLCLAFFLLL